MKKIRWIIAILVGLLILFFIILHALNFGKDVETEFGVTFSQKYAEELNIDWKEAYLASLEDLNIKKYRLIAYWDLIEAKRDVYDFSDLDWQIEQAQENDAEVVLAIGHRVPRWPECHWPLWTYQMEEDERHQEIQELIKKLVERYRGYDNIVMWQVENEPFLKVFGECPKPSIENLESNIELVKSLDDRPVVITESGELSTWWPGSKRADYVGTSIYRVVWNKTTGYWSYDWLPASFYYLKAQLAKKLYPVKDIFISEMQMEPWTPGMPLLKTPLEDQGKSMNPKQFDKNIAYAKRTGLSPVYLWGVEWWYWVAEQGDVSMWEKARAVFKG